MMQIFGNGQEFLTVTMNLEAFQNFRTLSKVFPTTKKFDMRCNFQIFVKCA
jgi:hypothetical protein